MVEENDGRGRRELGKNLPVGDCENCDGAIWGQNVRIRNIREFGLS